MKLSKKDRLYNAILEAVKNNCDECDVGTVRAALSEVETAIVMNTQRTNAAAFVKSLRKKEPRE